VRTHKESDSMPDNCEISPCNFEVCKACKHSCCQDAKPPLTKERITIIAEYLRDNGKSADNFFARASYSFPAVDSDEFCSFYDKTTKACQVHDTKPETCRAGPVTFDINRTTKKIEWYLKTRELCPLAGKLAESPSKLAEHLEFAKKELFQLVSRLDAEALETILARDEPQTFKIGEDSLPESVLAKLCLK
jgi:Fe-S-cluster containining protein